MNDFGWFFYTFAVQQIASCLPLHCSSVDTSDHWSMYNLSNIQLIPFFQHIYIFRKEGFLSYPRQYFIKRVQLYFCFYHSFSPWLHSWFFLIYSNWVFLWHLKIIILSILLNHILEININFLTGLKGMTFYHDFC